MKPYVFAAVLVAAFSGSAFAAEAGKYFVVIDTVGNCSVIQGAVSTGKSALGKEDGYDSEDAAMKALDEFASDDDTCEDIVS